MGIKVVGGLKYKDTIFYKENGERYKMVVHIRMDDECKNKICEFAITADIYELRRSYWRWCRGGCQHEAILKHAPQYKCFVDLHLCNHYGYGGLNGISNAIYWYKQKKYDSVESCLRLKEGELNQIKWFMEDENALWWELNEMGVVERWYQEALEAIEYLNQLTGCRWINPYSAEEERFVKKPLSDDERSLIEERVKIGYYAEKAVEERRMKALYDKIDEQKARAIEEFKKWQEILNIKLSILDEGILLDNVIVYEHSKEVTFNWKNWGEQVSREDFDRYISKIKSLFLFEDWKFNFGKDKK